VAGLGLVHSLYRAHCAVVPATAWHLVMKGIIANDTKTDDLESIYSVRKLNRPRMSDSFLAQLADRSIRLYL